MRISDWSSDVFSSDLALVTRGATAGMARVRMQLYDLAVSIEFCLQRTVGLADAAEGVATSVRVRIHPALPFGVTLSIQPRVLATSRSPGTSVNFTRGRPC